MGRAPCCDKANVKKGPWSPEEDAKLKEYIEKHGTGGNWIALPQKAGVRRCGKSCRLRWLNYLRPNIKHGDFSDAEDRIICSLFASIGSRWSIIAAQLPGRTDNDIKNYWNTKLKKKLFQGISAPSAQAHYNRIRPHNHQSPAYPFIPSHFSNSLPQHSTNESSSPYEYAISSSFYTPSFNNSPQAQDGNFGPMHGSSNYGLGGEASCSSSDGSCTTNQQIISRHGRDLDRGFSNSTSTTDTLSYFSSGFDGKADCYSQENPLDYSLQEINQLISTNSICGNNLNFFMDEIKTEERVLYY